MILREPTQGLIKIDKHHIKALLLALLAAAELLLGALIGMRTEQSYLILGAVIGLVVGAIAGASSRLSVALIGGAIIGAVIGWIPAEALPWTLTGAMVGLAVGLIVGGEWSNEAEQISGRRDGGIENEAELGPG